MALEIMKKLGLPELFEALIPKTHEKIMWSTLGQVLVVSRFCEASSELFIAEQFYRQSVLADLFGVSEGDIYHNRLYVSKPDKDLAWMLQKLQIIPPDRLTKEYKL